MHPIHIKTDLMKLLSSKKEKEGLDFILFMIVDILKQNCVLYAISEKEKEFVEKVFKSKVNDGETILQGIVSRKKQIVPPITVELSK